MQKPLNSRLTRLLNRKIDCAMVSQIRYLLLCHGLAQYPLLALLAGHQWLQLNIDKLVYLWKKSNGESSLDFFINKDYDAIKVRKWPCIVSYLVFTLCFGHRIYSSARNLICPWALIGCPHSVSIFRLFPRFTENFLKSLAKLYSSS